MGILKSVFKIPPFAPIQCCEPITLLDASFAHYSSTLFSGGRSPTSSFSIIFVTDCLKILQNFKCDTLLLPHYDISLNNFWIQKA